MRLVSFGPSVSESEANEVEMENRKNLKRDSITFIVVRCRSRLRRLDLEKELLSECSS